jgi:hypothetical protein
VEGKGEELATPSHGSWLSWFIWFSGLMLQSDSLWWESLGQNMDVGMTLCRLSKRRRTVVRCVELLVGLGGGLKVDAGGS